MYYYITEKKFYLGVSNITYLPVFEIEECIGIKFTFPKLIKHIENWVHVAKICTMITTF